ncbi:gpi mannosyltransferase 2 like protein [Zymoseptoria brevis]|uniref:GPI mannosyltransferase 2 n=1 Tax=Zymoseptoria brevis TaxID=1047168 RepID=A0A0F4GPK3_9PEZI|nr:gpi mannosyltransferase 2 like protein [Zymoseptoria brevis]
MARSAEQSTRTSSNVADDATTTSRARLVIYFLIWKAALLLVACASPGPGYDTSTQLFFAQNAEPSASSPGLLAQVLQHVAIKLTRWDAIYFTSASVNGLVYEQQWAFSPTFARITSLLAGAFPSSLCTSTTCHGLSAILISHVSHLIAVLVLHSLVLSILPFTSKPGRAHRIAFTTACLHILSPAGLFLSAAYGESTFAFLNFSGMLAYALSTTTDTPKSRTTSSLYTLLSGTLFALATLIRSNGLFSGLILLWDALTLTTSLLTSPSSCLTRIPRLATTILSGTLIALAYTLPQYFAYLEFCSNNPPTELRPWCTNTLPSIYSFVQSHYWNVGLFRYWTLSNLPLFLLATPMLLLLTATALTCCEDPYPAPLTTEARNQPDPSRSPNAEDSRDCYKSLMRRFAAPQLFLVVLAITTFHVQIVNRIASGYPVVYLMVAIAMEGGGGQGEERMGWLGRERVVEWVVRAGVVYAVVQGGLYASFMPPA